MADDLPEPISDEEALRLLREFLRQLEKMLAEIAESPRPAIPGRHHESMNAAWAIVRPVFGNAVVTLQTPPYTSSILPTLRDAGLTGQELVFKLSIFRHARDQLIEHGTPKEGEQRGGRWWARWRRLVKPALKAADVILGSLAKAIPMLEAVKEYKEAVEAGVDLGGATDE